MKRYSAFPKAPALPESHHQIVYRHIQDTSWGGSYPSAEKQSVYSTAPADWENLFLVNFFFVFDNCCIIKEDQEPNTKCLLQSRIDRFGLFV